MGLGRFGARVRSDEQVWWFEWDLAAMMTRNVSALVADYNLDAERGRHLI